MVGIISKLSKIATWLPQNHYHKKQPPNHGLALGVIQLIKLQLFIKFSCGGTVFGIAFLRFSLWLLLLA